MAGVGLYFSKGTQGEAVGIETKPLTGRWSALRRGNADHVKQSMIEKSLGDKHS